MEYTTHYETTENTMERRGAANRMDIENVAYPKNLLKEVFEDDETMVYPSDIRGSLEYLMAEFLSPLESEVLHLRFQQKLTWQSIAKICGKNENAVRMAQIRGIRKLRHPRCSRYLEEGVKTMHDLLYIKQEKQEYKEIKDYLQRIEFAMTHEKKSVGTRSETKSPKEEHIMNLDLSVRAFDCLARAGIRTVDEILAMPNANALLRIRNLGRKSYREIVDRLDELGYNVTHLR